MLSRRKLIYSVLWTNKIMSKSYCHNNESLRELSFDLFHSKRQNVYVFFTKRKDVKGTKCFEKMAYKLKINRWRILACGWCEAGSTNLNLPLFINIDYLFRSSTNLLAGWFYFNILFLNSKYSYVACLRLTKF